MCYCKVIGTCIGWFAVPCRMSSGARQGAIDLVQMELQWRDPRQAAARLRRYRQFYHPPRRLFASTAAAPSQLEAAHDSASADPADSIEPGGTGAGMGGQISRPPPAAAPSNEHTSHAPPASVAAAGEQGPAAGTEQCAASISPRRQAAEPEPNPERAAAAGPEPEAQHARRAPLASIRHALRTHRKAPGDGLLHAPLRTGMALTDEGADLH